jgi:hypothetical protein
MKLLTEYTNIGDLQILTENVEGKKPIYRIKGPFLQANVKNRNGRKYPIHICQREIQNFQDKILKKRSMGELDHALNPNINLDRVSHLIESLDMVGDDGIGVAKLLNTPKGLIAQTLIDEGILLGVSTRGVGTLTNETVNDDYKLVTVDIVGDPSAPNAFVEAILENKEYMITEGGDIIEMAMYNLKNKVDKKSNSSVYLKYIKEFLYDLSI